MRGFEAEPPAVEGKGDKTGVDEPKGAIRWQLKRSERARECAKNAYDNVIAWLRVDCEKPKIGQ
jgi:hypothetical protein